MGNIFKKISSIFKQDVSSSRSKEYENQRIISLYHQVKEAIPDYSEPNYTLARKVFHEFNDFNLKIIDEIDCYLIPIPKSLLPYPKNYIKCAYYLFLEEAEKQKDLEKFKLIQGVGC